MVNFVYLPTNSLKQKCSIQSAAETKDIAKTFCNNMINNPISWLIMAPIREDFETGGQKLNLLDF